PTDLPSLDVRRCPDDQSSYCAAFSESVQYTAGRGFRHETNARLELPLQAAEVVLPAGVTLPAAVAPQPSWELPELTAVTPNAGLEPVPAASPQPAATASPQAVPAPSTDLHIA